MIHVPALRAGQPYRSLDVHELNHISTGEPVALLSQVNAGIVSRDLRNTKQNQQALGAMDSRSLLEMLGRAAELFLNGELLVDPVEGVMQTADDYVRTQSSTTGMPESLCRANMTKVHFVMAEAATVIAGLTRGLDLATLDRGWGNQDGRTVSYRREADSLGAVLPSNSPGVHSLWVPAIALKVPVVLKPGSQEPWTPMRILQALLAAGCPAEALGFYPTTYAGAAEILLRTDRSMIFGDESTVAPWRQDPRVQLHGPGWSKVILGEDAVDGWQDHLDLIVSSVADNGGRSCINASGVWVPRHGKQIADALAQRMAKIVALPLTDPAAPVAAFSNPVVAHKISEYIDSLLADGGAEDLTAKYRGNDRVVEVDGCTFLQPTVIWSDDPSHPIVSCEFLFPFVSVVECPQAQLADRIGPTLVATAITEDDAFAREMMLVRDIDRLNLGAFPTSRVSWDQPHEGNLFEHLYRQRAFQSPDSEAAA